MCRSNHKDLIFLCELSVDVYLLGIKIWIFLSVNTTIIFVWIHGSGQAIIFDLEDEQTCIRRDEST